MSKCLNAVLACLRGNLFLYQGEELGLPETPIAYEDLQDPFGKNVWPLPGRDGCRTPMPWTRKGKHGGFTAGKTYAVTACMTSDEWAFDHDMS